MSNLTEHAKRELKLAGLFDKDSDYDGMIGEAVLELVEVFAKQGHSGMSAGIVLQLFTMVANWKPLTELTNDKGEWNDVSEMSNGPLWQSQRRPDAFSKDGGKTYYLLDDDKKIITSKKS